MNYFIKRDLQEYGPYTLSELQRYVASGNVLLTDLCRSEALNDWVPVSQVIGNIPVPAAAPAPTQASLAAAAAAQYPAPPSLHWGIALLLTIVTCFIFSWVWLFVQAAWIKKVQPNSKAIIFFGVALGAYVLAIFVTISLGLNPHDNPGALGLISLMRLVQLGVWITLIAGCFSMKNSIEEHYNTAEPIGLSLNGGITFIMSFFFLGHIYFQYHFTQINEMRRSQGLMA
jgi:hypothetical protein